MGTLMRPERASPSDSDAVAKTGRRETPNEQRDRNLTDLLQELRVMQTGTQIIAGFLLTLPFQQRFAELNDVAVLLYLTLVIIAATATGFMLVPVAIHRELFGLRIKERVVVSGHKVVRIVLWLVGALVSGTTALIFYVVLGGTAAIIVAAVLGAGVVTAVIIYPRIIRKRS